MASETLSQHTRDFDYYIIVSNAEYLPNKQTQAALSVEFVDLGVAEHSLKHIKKTYPEAYIVGYQNFVADLIDPEKYEMWGK